jgi:hypothetical protein
MESVTIRRKSDFISALNKLGGSPSNSALRRHLSWDEDLYSRVHGRLSDEGKIRTGRGRGGTVLLVEQENAALVVAPTTTATPARKKEISTGKERELYTEDLRTAIESWLRRRGVEDIVVEPTHSRGSKATGGTFTRPDYTAALRKEYRYVATNVEVITFEVKPESEVTVLGVMEALAHRESAHRAFVLYAVSEAQFNSQPEAHRIIELASKYGIGVIVAELPGDLDSWEEVVDEERNNPDPDRLERLIGDLPDGKVKQKLAHWK